jgi:hypothetical protein
VWERKVGFIKRGLGFKWIIEKNEIEFRVVTLEVWWVEGIKGEGKWVIDNKFVGGK